MPGPQCVGFFMEQGVVADLKETRLYSGQFSSCAPVICFNEQTQKAGYYHMPGTDHPDKFRDVDRRALETLMHEVQPTQVFALCGAYGTSGHLKPIVEMAREYGVPETGIHYAIPQQMFSADEAELLEPKDNNEALRRKEMAEKLQEMDEQLNALGEEMNGVGELDDLEAQMKLVNRVSKEMDEVMSSMQVMKGRLAEPVDAWQKGMPEGFRLETQVTRVSGLAVGLNMQGELEFKVRAPIELSLEAPQDVAKLVALTPAGKGCFIGNPDGNPVVDGRRNWFRNDIEPNAANIPNEDSFEEALRRVRNLHSSYPNYPLKIASCGPGVDGLVHGVGEDVPPEIAAQVYQMPLPVPPQDNDVPPEIAAQVYQMPLPVPPQVQEGQGETVLQKMKKTGYSFGYKTGQGTGKGHGKAPGGFD